MKNDHIENDCLRACIRLSVCTDRFEGYFSALAFPQISIQDLTYFSGIVDAASRDLRVFLESRKQLNLFKNE